LATALGRWSYRIKDAEGIVSNHVFYATFDDSKTMANIQTESNAFAAVLDPMTEGEIVNAEFSIVLTLTGLKGAPVADSDIQETLLSSFVQSGSFYKWGDDIPAYIDAINVNGRIDLTNATYVTYVTFMTTATGGFTPAGRMVNALVALSSGVETFRTKRKQLNAKSKTLA